MIATILITVLAVLGVSLAEGRANANIAEAEGQAEANRFLTESLSPEILTQRYIDALNEGTVFVVPEGSTPLVTTTK